MTGPALLDREAGREGAGREYLRFHLGRRIATDHVLDGQAAAGVAGQPSVELEHEVLEDDNRVSVGNHVLDHPWRQHLVALRDGGHGGVGGCRPGGREKVGRLKVQSIAGSWRGDSTGSGRVRERASRSEDVGAKRESELNCVGKRTDRGGYPTTQTVSIKERRQTVLGEVPEKKEWPGASYTCFFFFFRMAEWERGETERRRDGENPGWTATGNGMGTFGFCTFLHCPAWRQEGDDDFWPWPLSFR